MLKATVLAATGAALLAFGTTACDKTSETKTGTSVETTKAPAESAKQPAQQPAADAEKAKPKDHPAH